MNMNEFYKILGNRNGYGYITSGNANSDLCNGIYINSSILELLNKAIPDENWKLLLKNYGENTLCVTEIRYWKGEKRISLGYVIYNGSDKSVIKNTLNHKINDIVMKLIRNEYSDDFWRFQNVRENALKNPNLYDGRYSQKNRIEAFKQWLNDKLNRV